MSFRTCFVVALVGIAWSCVLGLQRPPPRYSQQYMPETAFSCRNKIVGSYYADPETDCQLFHVCVSVAGSVQDYKFLCPNDTAFDQESQTCADWYDVDCEAATLYYASDNFDLYRLGSGLESLHYDSVRSDAEPQDNLQRSETSDPVRSAANSLNRVTPTNANSNSNSNSNSRDILRGSSSINFYNSRNSGKDEDYENEKVYEAVQEPKKKNGVRKIARKQQHNTNNNVNNINLGNNYGASSTVAPVVASSPNTNNYNGNYYNNRQRTTGFPSSTTQSPVSQDNYNVRNQNNQKYNTPASTYRPSTAQQTYSTYQAPSTTARTTAYNNYNSNNNNQQQTSNSYGQNIGTSPKTTSYSQNYPSAAVTTARTTSYSQNYPDQQNFNNQYSQFAQNARTQSTTVEPTTNFDYTKSTDYTNFQRNYNNIQRSSSAANTFPSTTAASTFFDNYNTNNGQYNKASGQPATRQATQTTKNYPPNYAGSSYIPTTYSPATNRAVINENTPVQGNGRGVDRYNAQATGSDNGQYNNQQSAQFYDSTRAPKKQQTERLLTNDAPAQNNGRGRSNSQANGNDNGQYGNQQNQQASKSTQYYDSTRAPKKATQLNGNYDITNNGKYYESSTGNYDNGRSQGGIGFSPSSINHLAETPRSTTPVPKRTGGPTTYNPNSYNANNQARQTPTTPRGTTFVSGSARPFSTTARFTDATTPRSKSAKKNDYDYAYYDNAGGLEYDGLDLEHVVAGNKESSKISRN